MDCKLQAKDYISQQQIIKIIETALKEELPLSMMRIGDGENIVLAQEKVLTLNWIKTNVSWRFNPNYCGIVLPNLEARDRCIKAVREADLLGVFAADKLTERALGSYQITPKKIFYAFNNIYLPMEENFVRLIAKYPPLLVGKPAERFAQFLADKLKITVPGTVNIKSYADIDNCIAAMAEIPHQWSLISAGANSLIIANEMAGKYKKVAIDFGHAPDNVMAPNYKDYWLTIPRDL